MFPVDLSGAGDSLGLVSISASSAELSTDRFWTATKFMSEIRTHLDQIIARCYIISNYFIMFCKIERQCFSGQLSRVWKPRSPFVSRLFRRFPIATILRSHRNLLGGPRSATGTPSAISEPGPPLFLRLLRTVFSWTERWKGLVQATGIRNCVLSLHFLVAL